MNKEKNVDSENIYSFVLKLDDLLAKKRQLEQENKCLQMQLDRALKDYDELEERIDKAIEYIEKYQTEYEDVSTGINIKMIETWKVLEILKGDSNE